jgi:hypothetical protein
VIDLSHVHTLQRQGVPGLFRDPVTLKKGSRGDDDDDELYKK